MKNNILYDLVVIGASQEGTNIAIKVKQGNPNLNVAIVSSSLASLSANEKNIIDTIEATVIFSEFNHGLIHLSLNDRTKVFSKKVVIATGASPIKLELKNLPKYGVYYHLADIPKLSKNSQVLVIGNSKEAIQAAVSLSKKVNYVYLAVSDIKEIPEKVDKITNIAPLLYSQIESILPDYTGSVGVVNFKNKSSIHCSAILALLGSTLNNFGIAKSMIELNNENKIIIDHNCRTTKVASIYAVGPCAAKYSKAAGKRLISILLDE